MTSEDNSPEPTADTAPSSASAQTSSSGAADSQAATRVMLRPIASKRAVDGGLPDQVQQVATEPGVRQQL